MTTLPYPNKLFLETLDDLLEATEANIERAELIRRRIGALHSQVADGQPLVEIIAAEPSPLIVELITENINGLQELGARLRWSQASMLRADGMSAADIARLFGVSRQRVSALLNSPPAAIDS